MAKRKSLQAFKQSFDTLATNDCIGDPRGKPAYLYIRVSSDEQAEEGRSGLPRQIENCHQKALKEGYKIPWELVFADDDSGFEYEDRPGLSQLRREYKSPTRRAGAVVMEHIDRLSRNAEWHQGFLRHEMKTHEISEVFWRDFSSEIERAVVGTMAQHAMEQAKERMMVGNINKAKSGRVTARQRCYGFLLVDSQGRQGETAKKDTHYAIHDYERGAIEYIYTQIGIMGATLRQLATALDSMYPPPKKMTHWETRLISIMIRNPVYKGEFIAHRFQEIKVAKPSKDGLSTRKVIKRIQRPESEWIRVPVPAIVTPELWDMANRALDKNRETGRRNSKDPFLLTGLLKCATCGYSYIGGRKTNRKKSGKTYSYRFYRCSARHVRPLNIVREIGCDQHSVSCHYVDDAVWSVVCSVLLEPEILIQALESAFSGEQNAQRIQQIDYLGREIKGKITEDERLYRAYQAGAFDEHEFAARRKILKEQEQRLSVELEHIKAQVMTQEQFEAKRQEIYNLAAEAKQNGLIKDVPFEVKRRVLKAVVNSITLNVKEKWFRIEGQLSGIYPLAIGDNDAENKVSSHRDRGWSPLRVQSSREKLQSLAHG